MADTSNSDLQPSTGFTLSVVGLVVAVIAALSSASSAEGVVDLLTNIASAGVVAVAFAFGLLQVSSSRKLTMILAAAVLGLVGLILNGWGGGLFGVLLGAAIGSLLFWIHHRHYRKSVPVYLTSEQVAWHYGFRAICALILFFLIAPIVTIVPLSFNAQDFFTFTPEMLALDPEGFSLKHYRSFFGDEGNPALGLLVGLLVGIALFGVLYFTRGSKNYVPIIAGAVLGLIIGKMWGVEGTEWMTPLKNSLKIAPVATIISVSLGTLAAIGLSQSHVPFRRAIMAIMISPMIVPLIISAAGMYFFYSRIGLQGTYWGVVLSHAALGIPFVIITVTATLVGFDQSLTRAAANMGANPVTTFFRVQMPLILPGVISGGLFAFITSFDEVVVVLFVGSAGQQTLPWQMFTGLREQISPTILAAATVLITISVILLVTLELLRRRSERLRGMSPG